MALKIVLAGLGTALAAWLALVRRDHPPPAGMRAAGHPLPAAVPRRHCPSPTPVAGRNCARACGITPATPARGWPWPVWSPDESQDALLRAVAALAPSDPNSLRLRARQALAENQMELATDLLVKMTEHHLGGEEPPQLLARLLAGSEGMALLRPHLNAGSHWVPQVLANLVALKLPLEAGIPLLAEAAAKGLVPPATVQSFVRSLKAAGNWADAYGLWVAQQRQPVPLLFNGGFDQRFQADGFDWEVTPVSPGRAGALVSQRNLSGHGPVLEIQYTGRAVAIPVIRQYLFIAPGRYVLKGQYMSSKLRMEQGLAWAVRCTDPTHALAGRSGPLQDTAAAWQNFQFEFNVTGRVRHDSQPATGDVCPVRGRGGLHRQGLLRQLRTAARWSRNQTR